MNATGVMPVIFASSLLALPTALARYAKIPALESAATQLSPTGALYLPVSWRGARPGAAGRGAAGEGAAGRGEASS